MIPVKSYQKFLIDNGLVFEINRKVLHPLGLAMVVDFDRNNKRQLSVSIVETEDITGFIYYDEGFAVGLDKYTKFLRKIGQDRLDARNKKYGFIEQILDFEPEGD